MSHEAASQHESIVREIIKESDPVINGRFGGGIL
jgi:hypothetical protein